jgi:multiple sugar transport system substrate-binding protein
MMTTRRGDRAIRLNRRQMLGASVAGGAALAGLAAPGSLPGPAPWSAAAQEPVVLRFWLPGGSPVYCDVHNEIARDYSQLVPTIGFEEIQCGVGEGEDFIQILLGSIAAGNPPDATVIWDTPVSLGVQGALMPIDERMAASEYAKVENWPAGLLSSCQFGGVTYGLPVTSGLYGIWYSEELLESKGISPAREDFPKTWDDLRAMSKEFTVWDGDTLAVAGFIPIMFNAFEPDTLAIWSALNGSQLFDAENQTYTIDAEPNVAVMDYFISWLDEEYRGDINLVRNSGSWNAYANDEGMPPAFQEGRQFSLEGGSWVMGDYAAEIEPVATRWNVASYPVGPGGETTKSGFWPNWIAIPTGSAHPDEAFGYLDYLSGVGAAKWFSVVPDIPTNTMVPEVLPQIVVDTRGEEFAADIMAFWDEQAAVSTAMWNSPVENFARDQLIRAMERILTKAATPQEGLAEAQAACQAELEKVLQG